MVDEIARRTFLLFHCNDGIHMHRSEHAAYKLKLVIMLARGIPWVEVTRVAPHAKAYRPGGNTHTTGLASLPVDGIVRRREIERGILRIESTCR